MEWDRMKPNEQTLLRENGITPSYLSKNKTCLRDDHVGSSGHEADSHFKRLGTEACPGPDHIIVKDNLGDWWERFGP